jgi:hypothetical protein
MWVLRQLQQDNYWRSMCCLDFAVHIAMSKEHQHFAEMICHIQASRLSLMLALARTPDYSPTLQIDYRSFQAAILQEEMMEVPSCVA